MILELEQNFELQEHGVVCKSGGLGVLLPDWNDLLDHPRGQKVRFMSQPPISGSNLPGRSS